MARWCVRHGAQVAVWDSRQSPPQLAALREQIPGVEVRGGALDAQALQGVQLLLKSPGLAPNDPRVAAALQAARAADVPVAGELDLFVQALGALRAERDYVPQVLAVTGTNGKTTTTALTALLVERSGRSVVAAGNISPTMLDTLMRVLDEGSLPQVWVLELSSFQLDSASGFEPDAAAVLNLTQDHLDWHGDMAAYAAAKARIFGARTVAVINRDDALVEAMLTAPATPLAAKGRVRAAKPARRTVVRFGLGAPMAAGDYGLVTESGMAWLVRAIPEDTDLRRRKDDEPPELHLQRLMPADALRLRGRHNAANALAALALATAIGCPLAPMLHGLREYGGEPHRVQPVGRIGEVEAFDDSKGTNVGATVAALIGLGADKAPARLVVILGGDGKGQDFAPLAEPVARHARAVALIGRDAGAIEQALGSTGVPMQRHADLPQAVRWCFEQARPGDAVLLSPACASLDMFRNYGHRAAVFVRAVHELAAEHGEVQA
jgi:UDP-N-acetylmuramoylalanine--D-glutamate ligase